MLFDSADVSCSWVAVVRLAEGTTAVLKLGMPHFEGRDEMHGLRFWQGNAMVHLLRADAESGAMLLERCEPGISLRTLSEPEQDVVIADILRQLWQPVSAATDFRPLSALTEYWSQETLADRALWPDAGLVREGLRLFRELPDTAASQVLLATDLHAGNVLRAQRQPWLAIDPKPFVGDPAYDVTQHLLNCRRRLLTATETTIRRIADLAELESERVRLWLFARTAAEPQDDWQNSLHFTLAKMLAP